MTKKILAISRCFDCPFRRLHYGDLKCCHAKFGGVGSRSTSPVLGILGKIPEWCPLPDPPSDVRPEVMAELERDMDEHAALWAALATADDAGRGGEVRHA